MREHKTAFKLFASLLIFYIYIFMLFKHTHTCAGLNGVKRMKPKLEIQFCLLSNICQSLLVVFDTVIILIKKFCLLLSAVGYFIYDYYCFRVSLK